MKRLRLDKVVMSYILPENLVWWSLDSRGRYEDCLIKEVQDTGGTMWRYWCRDYWTRYDADGEQVGPIELHGYGQVPIIRLYDEPPAMQAHRPAPLRGYCGDPA